mmetsp:Transcript_36161/g.84541  ORF Transcript_36161/g.84541 Transcript_36161/m.84541 type:complete len:98 (+) Transcript_36161:164-457(+)
MNSCSTIRQNGGPTVLQDDQLEEKVYVVSKIVDKKSKEGKSLLPSKMGRVSARNGYVGAFESFEKCHGTGENIRGTKGEGGEKGEIIHIFRSCFSYI